MAPMFVRTTRVKQNGKVYEYPQLVRSYRRDSDGRSVTEVICSLKDWSSLEIENLKSALSAAGDGQTVAVAPESTGRLDGATITDNLAYLDVAVLSKLWRQWGFDEIWEGLVDDGQLEVPFGDIVLSLVLHRCINPGSKLAATRWFGRTVLPELTGIQPAQFNNSRIHRTLDELAGIEEALKARIPNYVQAQNGGCQAFYLDVTDTWFEGQGGRLSDRSKTKEGMTRKKVGIVLMCNESGFPCAWEVVAGRVADKPAMVELIDQIYQADWFGSVPMVVDRAMGTTAAITQLVERDVRFVTALRRNEFDSYTDQIPVDPLVDMEVDGTDAVDVAAARIEEQGFTQVDEKRYVRDLGVISKGEPGSTGRPDPSESVEDVDNRPAKYLEQADRINEGIRQGRWSSVREAGEQFGRSKGWASDRSVLRRIVEDIQQQLRDGQAPHLGLGPLKELSRLPADQQRARFAELKADRSAHRTARRVDRRKHPAPSEQAPSDQPAPPRVRAVVCFNPQQFVDQRRKANETVGQIFRKVSRLNHRARQGGIKAESLKTKLRAKLQSEHLLDAFDVQVPSPEERAPQLDVTLKESAWRRRRRYDGFSLLVAHPDLTVSAPKLDQMYRDKNAVEVDFRTIKSFAELRPVYHQTEAKIRAHVTICMLALVLERTLTEQLASMKTTGARALEEFADGQLNRIEVDDQPDEPLYTLTRPRPDHQHLLAELGMTELLDETNIQEEITPR